MQSTFNVLSAECSRGCQLGWLTGRNGSLNYPLISKSRDGLKAVQEKFRLLSGLSEKACESVCFLLALVRGQRSCKSLPAGKQGVNCKST